MSLLNSTDRTSAKAIAQIGFCNPFVPERDELERQAMGDRHIEGIRVRQRHPEMTLAEMFPNALPIGERGGELLAVIRKKLIAGTSASEEELITYEDLALVTLYLRHMSGLAELVAGSLKTKVEAERLWNRFRSDFDHYFFLPNWKLPSNYDSAHAFACLYQIERAYHHIFEYIVGGSDSAVRLRASIWESIFTCDMRRYARALYNRMGKIPSLILGPTGSGKELVARAIGLSRYIPFDAKTQKFKADFTGSFHAVNVAAFSRELVESELFGHKKGAFTGAIENRRGWLESCDPLGTVFLDEIGEVEPAVQVKLLRVLQDGIFQRMGENVDQEFRGKIIAATNRDLSLAMQEGRFREDLFYRLCADIVRTPSLRQQLDESPNDLPNLVRFVVARDLRDNDVEQAALTREVVDWIHQRLGSDYIWAGNFRELEQCVRNIMIRKQYFPAKSAPLEPIDEWIAAIRAGELTSDDLLTHYYRWVYRKTRNFNVAAKILNVDPRTVRKLVKLDPTEHNSK